MADHEVSVYQKMLLVVREIPRGRVATYGQIAWIVGAASPRMAGYALGGLPADTDIPWQRVVNRHGGISPRGDPLATDRQGERLADEGIRFPARRPHRSGPIRLGRAGPRLAGSAGLHATALALRRLSRHSHLAEHE